MVFQNYALYPNKTVYKNLAFPLQMRKLPNARDREEGQGARPKVLDIEHLLDRRPRELSGGQQQRVALGRALVRDPRAFLMDEPLSNLDAKLRVQMRAELKRFHQDLNATVIYVTHDQLEAMTMADKMAVMNGGVLQQYDSPGARVRQPGQHLRRGIRGQPGDEPRRRPRVAASATGASLQSGDGWTYALSPENARKALRSTSGASCSGAAQHHQTAQGGEAGGDSGPHLHGRADGRHHLRARLSRLGDHRRKRAARCPACSGRPGVDRARPAEAPPFRCDDATGIDCQLDRFSGIS